MSVFGPWGRVRVALAVLVVTVGALATVVAYDNRQPINLSGCGESTKVFVRPVSHGDRVFAVDLPAGVYLAKMIAVGDVDLGRASGRYERRFTVTVRSWLNDREHILALRRVHRVRGIHIHTRWNGPGFSSHRIR